MALVSSWPCSWLWVHFPGMVSKGCFICFLRFDCFTKVEVKETRLYWRVWVDPIWMRILQFWVACTSSRKLLIVTQTDRRGVCVSIARQVLGVCPIKDFKHEVMFTEQKCECQDKGSALRVCVCVQLHTHIHTEMHTVFCVSFTSRWLLLPALRCSICSNGSWRISQW